MFAFKMKNKKQKAFLRKFEEEVIFPAYEV